MNTHAWFQALRMAIIISGILVMGIVGIVTGLEVKTISYMTVIGSTWLIGCYLPQIVRLLKTKSAKGISVDFWLNLDIAILALTINSFVVYKLYGTWGMLLTEIMNLVLAVTVTALVIRYKLKEHKKRASN